MKGLQVREAPDLECAGVGGCHRKPDDLAGPPGLSHPEKRAGYSRRKKRDCEPMAAGRKKRDCGVAGRKKRQILTGRKKRAILKKDNE